MPHTDQPDYSTGILTVFSADNSDNFRSITAASVQACLQQAVVPLEVHSTVGDLPCIQPGYLSKSFTCQVSSAAQPLDIMRLRQVLNQHSLEQQLDYVFLSDKQIQQPYKLAVFDMDSTLIDAEVIVELAKYSGIGHEVERITESAMRGEIDFNESFRQRLALLKGVPESALQEIAHSLRLNPGISELVEALKANGCYTAIASGGFSYFAQHLQQRLGMDDIYANPLEIQEGQVTGRVVGNIVNGEAKAQQVRQWMAQRNLFANSVVVFGDGANDIAMMQCAVTSIAFRAKPKVKAVASVCLEQVGFEAVIELIQCLRK